MKKAIKNAEIKFQKLIKSEIVYPTLLLGSDVIDGIADYYVGATSYQNQHPRVTKKAVSLANEQSKEEIGIEIEFQIFKTMTGATKMKSEVRIMTSEMY